jgi:hypothetical protein
MALRVNPWPRIFVNRGASECGNDRRYQVKGHPPPTLSQSAFEKKSEVVCTELGQSVKTLTHQRCPKHSSPGAGTKVRAHRA